MKKSGWLTLAIIVVVILVAVAIIYFKNRPSDDVDEALVKCIAQKAILYVQLGCPHCEDQKKIFAEELEHVNLIDCWYNRTACEQALVQKIPTWIINGQQYTGKKTIEELKILTGC